MMSIFSFCQSKILQRKYKINFISFEAGFQIKVFLNITNTFSRELPKSILMQLLCVISRYSEILIVSHFK